MAREIINHRSLRHPNIIRFKEVRPWRGANWVFAPVRRVGGEESVCFFFFLCVCVMEESCLAMQVVVTPTHLAIVMEYAAGGELFDRICNAGRFSEDEVQRCSNRL